MQTSLGVPKEMTITKSLQYGVQDGKIFFVNHEEKHKKKGIYQHRYQTSQDLQVYLKSANNLIKKYTNGVVDLSWAAGN